MRRFLRLLRQLSHMSKQDIKRDWAMSLCQICALTAVLTPLLILHGLHEGVLGDLLEKLRTIPAMREITPLYNSTQRYESTWIDSVRASPQVGFIAGAVRSIAAEVRVVSEADKTHEPVPAILTPTGNGDPLRSEQTEAGNMSVERLTISFRLAQDLKLHVGDRISLVVPRFHGEIDETQRLTTTVEGIIPPELLSETESIILVPDWLAVRVEQYRDGYAVPELGWSGLPPPDGPMRFARFRLYARTLDDVAPLAGWLRGQGVVPNSRQEDVEPILKLDRSLRIILDVIGVFSSVGMLMAFAAIQWSAVERKKREIAQLSLVGYSARAITVMYILQAIIISIAGVAMAVLFGELLAIGINQMFPAIGGAAPQAACRISLLMIAEAFGGATFIGVAAAWFATAKIGRLDVALLLRDH